MFIKFEELTFQNILSFGSNPITINFQQGLSLIAGLNGSGKSCICDALSFCLFGLPYRKIKLKELINRKNKKNLKVSCRFVIDNRDQFTITRTMNPDSIEITKNSDKLELLSSKKLNQDEIDKILGINFPMFKQVISLAVNYNKPFLSLQLSEKREIIEQIFNIIVFGQMLKNLKKNNVEIKTKNEVNDKTIKYIEESLKSLRSRIQQLTETLSNFEDNKEKDLKIVNDRMNEYVNEKEQINNQIFQCSQNIHTIDEKNILHLKKERDIIIKDMNSNEYAIKSYDEMLTLLENNTVCPTCKSKITVEHKNEEIKILTENIINKSKNMGILKTELENIENQIKTHETEIANNNNFKFQLQRLNDKLSIIQREILNLEKEIQNITNRQIDLNLDSLKQEFETKKQEYKQKWKETKFLKNCLQNNDIVQNILSENGIKAYFFQKLVPILNIKINEYIKLFELNVMIQFDELMNEKIINLENLRNDISYYAYSEGEKKRIDMAILLSFISITKIISNWNCNLLIIDELLDSAIDENGLEKLVYSLKNMCLDANDLCVYIISHRLLQDYNTHFQNNLSIRKNNNGFSEITQQEFKI
jgi:DNA repair exonuclease SbcCD ATPase subunit